MIAADGHLPLTGWLAHLRVPLSAYRAGFFADERQERMICLHIHNDRSPQVKNRGTGRQGGFNRLFRLTTQMGRRLDRQRGKDATPAAGKQGQAGWQPRFMASGSV
jgi:hypothetical protein